MREIVSGQGIKIQVDDDDYDFLNQWTWHISPRGYAHRTLYRSGTFQDIALHDLVGLRMGISITPTIDHKDGNKLNCQRSNLRTATQFQQQGNRGPSKTNKCGYRGVSKRKGYERWVAYINRFFIGSYETPEEAALAWNKEATRRYGSFARLNKIPE